jgi:hypothetical protein
MVRLLSRILYLAGILLLVWFSLILGVWVIKLIVPITLPWPGLHVRAGLSIAKAMAGVLMVALWLYIWKFVSDNYFARAMRKRGIELK